MIALDVYGAPESFLQSRPVTSHQRSFWMEDTSGLTVTCDLSVLVLVEGDLYLTTETLTVLNHFCSRER